MIQWFLSKLRQEDITGRGDEDVYLSRYWLLGSRETRWALMLHKMRRPDDTACHHDHPWSFWTLVLKGGYVEEVTHPVELPYKHRSGTRNTVVHTRRNRPGMLLFRPAEHTHRISYLPNHTCWTLVLRFKRRRNWGFLTKLGWRPWKLFINLRDYHGVLWCGEDE